MILLCSCRHMWAVTLVTIQPISDDIKCPCRCRQVRIIPHGPFTLDANDVDLVTFSCRHM